MRGEDQATTGRGWQGPSADVPYTHTASRSSQRTCTRWSVVDPRHKPHMPLPLLMPLMMPYHIIGVQMVSVNASLHTGATERRVGVKVLPHRHHVGNIPPPGVVLWETPEGDERVAHAPGSGGTQGDGWPPHPRPECRVREPARRIWIRSFVNQRSPCRPLLGVFGEQRAQGETVVSTHDAARCDTPRFLRVVRLS
jgi:hypothetical protein